ncbi:7756_t:CDS:2, partial [Cetraspora pellucida]
MSSTSNQLQRLRKYIIENNINRYDYTHFRNVELIKNGRLKIVYRATFKNKVVILKAFKNNDLIINEVINELKLYNRVDIHPNIIRFYGVTKKEDSSTIPYMLIFEFAEGGTLKSYLHENSQLLSWNDKIKFSLQIVSAVRYLHTKRIANVELHSDNIFMHHRNIKLLDYGLSNRLKEQTVKHQNLRFHKQTDVYSVGLLMQEIYNNNLIAEYIADPTILGRENYIGIYI